jgi:uncharacterized protein YceH (UPF0502 family)
MTEPAGWTPLTAVEARVLAVLVEKRHTVPDSYPMSANALLLGCNQKSSREPVMDLGEAELQSALDVLRARSLVIESSGNRVMRYEENARRVLGVPSESVALLATLMLRGPQTTGELRAHCERLHRFSDVSATEAFLEELAERRPVPYVRRVPRQPGAREGRWAHLLCGGGIVAPDEPSADATGPEPRSDVMERLAARIERLEAEVAALRERVGPR